MTREEFKAKVSMALGSTERGTWEDFLEAVWQLHLEASNHWIPVEEELPKKDGKYLFYDEVLGHEVSIYYDGVTLVPSITHWMPLPTAPRKEE